MSTMAPTVPETAEKHHASVIDLLVGELGLVRPNINSVGRNEIVITTARHRAGTLIELVDDIDYTVVDREDIPKQPRDMHRYTTVRLSSEQ